MSEWEIIEEIKENASIKVIGVGGGGGNASKDDRHPRQY